MLFVPTLLDSFLFIQGFLTIPRRVVTRVIAVRTPTLLVPSLERGTVLFEYLWFVEDRQCTLLESLAIARRYHSYLHL